MIALRPALRSCLVALTLVVALLPCEAADRRVVVRPFEVYNAPDLEAAAPGLQAAFAGRLSDSGLQVVTAKDEDAGSAEWAVRVTLTRVGSRTSVDGAAESASGRGDASYRAYEIAENSEGILKALEAVAAKLRKELASAPGVRPTVPKSPEIIVPSLSPPTPPVTPPAPAVPTAPAVPAASAAPAPPAPQAAAARAPVAPEAPTAPAPPSVPSPAVPENAAVAAAEAPSVDPAIAAGTAVPETLAGALRVYRPSAPFSGDGKAVAVADVDRDGVVEVLVLSDAEIVALRDDGKTLAPAWRARVGTSTSPAYLSVGDVDGDGTPEVFVAGVRGRAPYTEVYQWSNGALVHRAQPVSAFLRAIVHPERGLLLLGQSGGSGSDLLEAKLRTYGWADGAYRSQSAFPAPSAVLVTDVDWHTLAGDGQVWTVYTSQGDTLRAQDRSGKISAEAGKSVKGSRNTLGQEDPVSRGLLDEQVWQIQGKSVLWKGTEARPYLIVQKNHSMTAVFRRAKSYTQNQVFALRWDDVALAPAAESPKIPGYLADVDLGPSPVKAGGKTLYGVLVQDQGLFSSVRTTRVLAWDLGP